MVLSAGQLSVGGHLTTRTLFLLGHYRAPNLAHESSLPGGLSLSRCFSPSHRLSNSGMGHFMELFGTCPQWLDLQVSWANEQRGPFKSLTNNRSPESYTLEFIDCSFSDRTCQAGSVWFMALLIPLNRPLRNCEGFSELMVPSLLLLSLEVAWLRISNHNHS